MIKDLSNIYENPRLFIWNEGRRIDDIKKDFPMAASLTATSFLDSNFITKQERDKILYSNRICAKEIASISLNMLNRFKDWFIQEYIDVVLIECGLSLTRENLNDIKYLEKVVQGLKNADVILWWLEEGKDSVDMFDELPIPYTLKGFHDEILSCNFVLKSNAYSSKWKKLQSIAELFTWEWIFIGDEHLVIDRKEIK